MTRIGMIFAFGAMPRIDPVPGDQASHRGAVTVGVGPAVRRADTVRIEARHDRPSQVRMRRVHAGVDHRHRDALTLTDRVRLGRAQELQLPPVDIGGVGGHRRANAADNTVATATASRRRITDRSR